MTLRLVPVILLLPQKSQCLKSYSTHFFLDRRTLFQQPEIDHQALFVIDVMKEHIAVKEAIRLGIPIFGIVDTNSDPSNIDYVIPPNDDATMSIDLIIDIITKAIAEGLTERKAERQ